MPIDPNIALQGKPVQFDGAGIVNMLQRGQALRMQQEAHAQQMQLGAQHLEAGQRAAAQADLKLKDDSISRQAFVDSGGDLDKWEQLLTQRGASADAVIAAQTHKQNLLKQRVETQKNQGEVTTARDKRMQGLIQETQQLAQANPNAYQQNWGQIYDAASQIDPDAAKHLDRNTPLPPDQINLFGLHYASQDWADKKLKEKREQAGEVRAEAVEQRASLMAGPQLEKAKADALAADLGNAGRTISKVTDQASYNDWAAQQPKEVQAVIPTKFDDKTAATIQRLGMTPDQAVTTGQTAERDAARAKNEEAMRKLGAGHLRISQGEFALKQKQFDATFGSGLDANGKPLTGDELKAMAQQNPTAMMIANYQMAPPSSRSAADPKSQALMRQVSALNPTYDATSFPARNRTATDFSAGGASGKALTSADTALAHLHNLSEAGKAMNNGDIQALNRIANAVGAQFGQSPQATYDAIVAMVAPEISKAVVGGTGGEGDRQTMANQFSSRLADNQRESNIGAVAGLLGARMQKSLRSYEQTMGKPSTWTPSAESQAMLTKYSGGGSGGTGGGSGLSVTFNGHVFGPFKDKAALDQFKKDQGIK